MGVDADRRKDLVIFFCQRDDLPTRIEIGPHSDETANARLPSPIENLRDLILEVFKVDMGV